MPQLVAETLKKHKETLYWDLTAETSKLKERLKETKPSNLTGVRESKLELNINEITQAFQKNYNLNIFKSDKTPLNRDVPDSRPLGCYLSIMRIHIRRIVFLVCIVFASICIASTLYFTVFDKRSHAFRRVMPQLVAETLKKNEETLYWDLTAETSKLKERLKETKPSNLTGVRESKLELNINEITQAFQKNYNLNIFKSDKTPLNRDVPDSRPLGCASLKYPDDLPTTSVVIPFHNEWPSVILRTLYALFNRTPQKLLKQIILVDDASDVEILKTHLKFYIEEHFPKNLVTLIRLETRQGLIRARLEGLKYVTSQVVSFFDSHMEVNYDWLQPLLYEVVKNKQTIAMGQLDYIHRETLDYNFYPGYRTRYGFRWDMQFFETYFRPDQLKGKKDIDPMPGVLMVGPGFTVDVEYFKSIGTYDENMMIWGGENIELAWRVWMCGGQLLHIPCSHIGHIERSQPYSFPRGRGVTEMHNYKRAVDVWLGDYKIYVYNLFPGMKSMDVGDLSERLAIKSRLKCQDFSWFIKNIWPELMPYKDNALIWGQISTPDGHLCLDNNDYVFQDPVLLLIKPCSGRLQTQGFSLSKDGFLQATIHCVVIKAVGEDLIPHIQNCFLSTSDKWLYTEEHQLIHKTYSLCLQVLPAGTLFLQPCKNDMATQKWVFNEKKKLCRFTVYLFLSFCHHKLTKHKIQTHTCIMIILAHIYQKVMRKKMFVKNYGSVGKYSIRAESLTEEQCLTVIHFSPVLILTFMYNIRLRDQFSLVLKSTAYLIY
ncbi:Polypeptide N-acetylgalactosaminyltransferase 5 [Bulinus truncatus]|nr:Polypeptide N-acetylgalactosaminyltransferase 5 [Bulinus truncatus]